MAPHTEHDSRRRFSWAVIAAAVSVAVFLAWLAFGFGGPWVTTAVDDLGELAVALLAGFLCLRRATGEQGRTRQGWILLGLSAFSWGLGEAAWSYYELVGGVAIPFPGLPDVGFLASIPLALAGMLAFFSAPMRWTSRLRVVVDALIVGGSVLYISWFAVLGPLFRSGEGTLLAQVIGLAYPAGDVVILSVVLLVAARNRSDVGLPIGWIAAGLTALAVSDSAFAYLTQQGSYVTGLLDAGWFSGYLLIALAAAKPRRSVGDAPASSRELTLLPYVPVVAVLAISGGRFLTDSPPDPFLNFDRWAVFVFVVVRQVLTIWENLSLTLNLEAKVAARTADLARSEERFRSLIQNVSDVISVVRPDGMISYVSPSVEAVFGYDPDELVEQNVLDLLHPEDTPALVAFLQTGGGGGSRRLEIRLRHQQGDWRFTEALGRDLSEDPAVGGFLFTTRDVTERRQLEEQLVHQAFHDPLTGLANRALLADRIGHGLARIGRTGRDLAVIFIDIDDFKAVNDTRGHASGDELLSEVARRLEGCVRQGDTVARLGGDEFAVLMEDAGEDVAVAVAARLQEALAAPIALEGGDVLVSASVGIARSGSHTTSPAEILRNADVAMYQAKASGKARHELFRPEMHEKLVLRVELLGELRCALDKGEFVVHYQPLVELRTGELAGFEALVRWQHPTRGIVPPLEFIPLAEETGLIVPIGSWVLEQAVDQLHIWDALGATELPLSMSVNVSARQLGSPDLVEAITDALARTGVAPERLTLELTESILMDDMEGTLAQLWELRGLGVRLAIDDFGTGFSSLSYLRRLPVDTLKIDKSFVDDLGSDRGAELARALVDLAASLGLDTVAEGIEHHEQAEILHAHGCRLGQGYVFSRPLPAAAIETLLTTRVGPGGAQAGVHGRRSGVVLGRCAPVTQG